MTNASRDENYVPALDDEFCFKLAAFDMMMESLAIKRNTERHGTLSGIETEIN